MTEFRRILREYLQAAIADMERLSRERHVHRKEVLTGETSLLKSGSGGTRASNPGDLDDQAPRPTTEDS